MRLSAHERETIINFNEAESVAYIYTCNRAWITHLEGLGLKPTAAHQDRGRVYAREYELPKSWVRKPAKPRQLTPEQRERLKLQMARVRETAGAQGEALRPAGAR